MPANSVANSIKMSWFALGCSYLFISWPPRGAPTDQIDQIAASDLTERHGSEIHSLPEIKEGEVCVPDRLYKMDCNRCRCTKAQTLMCTKMACFNWKNLKPKAAKKALRADESKEQSYLPSVQKGTVCKPGKLYRAKCKRCYCTDENKLVCSNKPKEACTFDKYGNPPAIQKPEDVHPNIQLEATNGLEKLHSASEQCTPGKTFQVDCNLCICMENNNLLCQKKLCLSYDDMNRIDAKELSGKTCTEEETLPSQACKTCKCVEGKTLCSVVPDCSDKPMIQQLNGQEEPPEQLDPEADGFRCVPHSIYKVDCNKCYCQEDSTLRCTQKTCLNYTQVKLLEEQREYLDRHGL